MKRFLIRLVISVLIGGVMLLLAARGIEFDGTWEALRDANWWVLLPYAGLMAIQHLFRSWRWGFLLAPIHPVPFSRILPISSVGFFAILALPLRMGEFVRPYLIADPPRLRMSHALGTMAVERVFDGLVLALGAFFVVAVARSRTTVPTWVEGAGVLALTLFCIALAVLVMTLWQRDRAVTLCRRLVGIFSPRLAERAASIARGVVDGFRVLPDLKRLLPFVGSTVAYWFLNALGVLVLGRGFGIHLTVLGSVAVIALVGIGIMIPAGPGFIGNFELFADAAIKLYAPAAAARTHGAAFILVFHATNALWYIFAGLLGMLSSHVTFRKVWTVSTHTDQVSPADDAGVAAAPGGETGQLPRRG